MKYIHDAPSLELFQEKCTGCGVCVEVCPRGVYLISDRKAVITDKDLCMECGACALNCAFDAIRVDSGVGCASAIINGMISGGDPSCGCGTSTSSGANCC